MARAKRYVQESFARFSLRPRAWSLPPGRQPTTVEGVEAPRTLNKPCRYHSIRGATACPRDPIFMVSFNRPGDPSGPLSPSLFRHFPEGRFTYARALAGARRDGIEREQKTATAGGRHRAECELFNFTRDVYLTIMLITSR